jgi:hypothetical protein
MNITQPKPKYETSMRDKILIGIAIIFKGASVIFIPVAVSLALGCLAAHDLWINPTHAYLPKGFYELFGVITYANSTRKKIMRMPRRIRLKMAAK